jgi:3-hydroxyacyl-CoA dehydrogenase/enoyl-CoA hydratase/3-hydroxybutyryl-CoA epimerase
MTTMVETPVEPKLASVLLEAGPDGVHVLRLGAPAERMLTLSVERMESLDAVLERLAGDDRLRGLIVTGPGPGMFAAGADIHGIAAIADESAGRAASARGQRIFARFEQLPVPVVAAIEGPCLGGGCELALACDLRVLSSAPGTSIGLPEVKLGIVPGFGGTQRLPRLIGLPAALDLILNGKLLEPRQALKLGLVDRVVAPERLLAAARSEVDALLARGRKRPRRRLRGAARWLSRPPLRALVARRVRRTLREGQARFYEAPRLALELCLDAFRRSRSKGFAREADLLGRTIVSPTAKALIRLFFLTERSKKLGKQDGAATVRRAITIGGGVMGAGIAGLLAGRGIESRLCDLDPGALARAKARLGKDLQRRVARRRLARHEAVAIQDRLVVALDWGSLRGVDLFLEAVVEDVDVKRSLFRRATDLGLPATALLATNTSSLPIDAMAEGQPAPERVVGLHFFNPPEKMPLVEVIRGTRTGDAAVATACKLAVSLGKFPIVVRDRPGFLVNRCLAPYLNEAAALLLEGNEPEFVDRVMLDFGMPMGPVRLLDEVGLDVAAKVSAVLAAAFPERMQPSPLCRTMVEAGALGQKSGGGFYDASGKRPGPGRVVLDRMRQRHAGAPCTKEQVEQRLLYPIVDEAYRCLDELVVLTEEDLDLGLVMGIGFPPFLGGITGYARQVGLKRIVDGLDELARRLGPRFAPPDALRRRAVSGS